MTAATHPSRRDRTGSYGEDGRLVIRGGRPLTGTYRVGGAKNAALPLMVAALLGDGIVTLRNAPRIADTETLTQLLVQAGAVVRWTAESDGSAVSIAVPAIDCSGLDGRLIARMRASFLMLGALLARCGHVAFSLPGGDDIGLRPVDLHLAGLRAMGAEVGVDGNTLTARAPAGLRGARIVFPSVSVGATEHLMIAAALTPDRTVLVNAAKEPEVGDLAHLLVAMGAGIEGIGTDTLTIDGAARLGGAIHTVVPDRVELGTMAMAAGVTGGDLEILGGRLDLLGAAAGVMEQAGLALTPTADGLRARRRADRLVGADVLTQPFPGFATDLQAPAMAMLAVADGAAMITETIFPERFRHVPQLARMGARIKVQGSSAIVRGVERLSGAAVEAPDIRAGAALVLAGLGAEGRTVISGAYHIDRGYERFEEKLTACGADVEREPA